MGGALTGGISDLIKRGLFSLHFAISGQPSANKEAGLTRNCLLFDPQLPSL